MKKYKIESGIPLTKQSKYDYLLSMKDGDSILVEDRSTAQNVRSYMMTKGFKAITRTTDVGVRVWVFKDKK